MARPSFRKGGLRCCPATWWMFSGLLCISLGIVSFSFLALRFQLWNPTCTTVPPNCTATNFRGRAFVNTLPSPISSQQRRETESSLLLYSPLLTSSPLEGSAEEKKCAKDGQRLQKRAGGCIGGLREDTPCMVLMVPFRSRPNGDWDALMDWVGFMRNFFAERPQIRFTIAIVEQSDCHSFNRGKLLNAGFVLMESFHNYDYYCFHDMDERPWPEVEYGPPMVPTHMMTARSRWGYAEVAKGDRQATGGVFKMSAEDFRNANGYSNSFWSWGHEDEDFGIRIQKAGLGFDRLPFEKGRFVSIEESKHPHRDRRHMHENRRKQGHSNPAEDGLHTLDFTLESESRQPGWSHFVVSL